MAISTVINKRLKKFLFIQEINRIRNNPQTLINNENDILQRLVYLWGNEGWSGLSDYLKACLEYTNKSNGYVLECGSGLSSILIGIVAQSKNIQAISLENSSKWRNRTNWYLKRFKLNNSKILFTPIKSMGDYEWYSIEEQLLPKDVALVILDGPPGDISGGRSGFFRVCNNIFKEGSIILVDDVERKQEMDIVLKYSAELDFDYSISNSSKPYAVMVKK